MFKDDPTDPMSYFRDISTFGGCTSGPAAALENMRIIEDEGLLENTIAMGDYTLGKLGELMGKHRVIGDVRGKGLFLGPNWWPTGRPRNRRPRRWCRRWWPTAWRRA